MKDQYFGDINDYRKYGLLRSLQSSTKLNLLVAWMLTPDDGRRDGELRDYLQQPHRWKHFDPELYSALVSLLGQTRGRSVSLLESANLIPRAAFFSALVPDERRARNQWRADLASAASGADLVFLDPDNGLEVASKPIGRKGSSKYLAWQEVDILWSAGRSLLIYQHFPRKTRDAFVTQTLATLRARTEQLLVPRSLRHTWRSSSSLSVITRAHLRGRCSMSNHHGRAKSAQ